MRLNLDYEVTCAVLEKQLASCVAAKGRVSEQRDQAFDLLAEYFDIHRHDPKVRELQLKVEKLLYGN